MGRYAATVALLLTMGASVHAQKEMFVVTSMSADVHKAPSTGSAVIGKAPRGKAFEVRRELGSWVAVAWPEGDAGIGYLHMTWGTMSVGAAAETSRASSATSSPVPSPSQSEASATTTQIGQTPGTRAVSAPAPSLPSHVIGLGGRMGTQALGLAATGRAWTQRRIGAQLELGKSTYTTAFSGDQLTAMQFAPSVIYSPRNLVTNAIWARPYFGGAHVGEPTAGRIERGPPSPLGADEQRLRAGRHGPLGIGPLVCEVAADNQVLGSSMRGAHE